MLYWTRFRRGFRSDAHLLHVDVDVTAFLHNLEVFQSLCPQQRLVPVLKSNAYGHGLTLVARAIHHHPSVAALAVDSIVEARALRRAGIYTPLMVIGYVPRALLRELCRLGSLIYVVTSLAQAVDVAERVTRALDVHIKVDTGMHRQGVTESELPQVIRTLQANRHLRVCGLATHLGDADGEAPDRTRSQLVAWSRAREVYRSLVREPSDFHVAQTAGTAVLDGTQSTFVRLGLGLYGFDTVPSRTLPLRPALSFWAKIVNVKTVAVGEWVGYNATYVASSPRTVAVLPCGYADGVSRALSNLGVVYVRGRACPIVGRVSMNMMTIDVTEIPDVRLEEDVEVISANTSHQNSVVAIAHELSCIPYELLVGLSANIRRRAVQNPPVL